MVKARVGAGRERRDRGIGLALVIGGLLLVSLDSLGIRLAGAGPWATAFCVGAFTAVSMLLVAPSLRGDSLWARSRRHGLALLVSGMLQATATACFILALDHTTVANTMVIFAAAPVIAAWIARLAIREKTSSRTWVGIAGSIVGIGIVTAGSLGAGRIAGDLFAIAAIVAFGSNLTLWRRLPDLDRQAVIGMGGLMLSIAAWSPADLAPVDARALAILAVIGLLTGPLGRVGVAMSTRYLPVSEVSLLTPVEAIAATTWAWLFLAEAPPATALVGGGVVIASLVFGVAGGGARGSHRGEGSDRSRSG